MDVKKQHHVYQEYLELEMQIGERLAFLYLMCSFYSYFHRTLNSSSETMFLTQLDDWFNK